MKQPKWALTTLVILMALMLPTVASAQAPDQPVSRAALISPQSAQAAEAYWTEERMRAAKPMPLPTPSRASLQGLTVPPPGGPPLIATSGRPGATPQEFSGAAAEQLLSEPEPQFGTFPFSYTRYRLFPNNLTMYTTFPYLLTGKLFFTIPGRGNFVCSASSINSANRSVVWTAGHCVATPGVGFHTNIVFSPGRLQGQNPRGLWTARVVNTLNGWFFNGLFNYDHGAFVANRLGGVRIGDRIGFLGFAANIARQQHWHLHGYPAGARNLAQTPPGAQFDGEHHEICSATFATNDQPGRATDPPTIGVGCDKTGGTSGGPWVVNFSGVGGATNTINGNNSYRYTCGTCPPNNLRLYSPYFTTGAINLRNALQNIAN
jgi:hypothetical protein